MSSAELQEEEREVLISIYEGDDNFRPISDTVYQYKVGDDGHHHSLLLEVTWTESYPDQLPDINLDAFYNKNILPEIKEAIVNKLKEQAEMFLGCAMTYSLFEWAKENHVELMVDQPELLSVEQASSGDVNESGQPQEKKVKEKKEQLTKSQKRRLINRVDLKTGEKPRGWDWMDIIRHLSQTGGATK